MDFGEDNVDEFVEEPDFQESDDNGEAREDLHAGDHDLPKVETQFFSMSPAAQQVEEKPTCVSIGVQTEVHLLLNAMRVN